MAMCCKCRLQNNHYFWIRWFTYLVDAASMVYKITMRILSPLLFFLANMLILSVVLIFIFVFFPLFFEDSVILHSLCLLFGLYLVVNVFFNYFLCAFTPPGSPPYCPDPGRILGEKVSIVDGRKIYQFSYQLSVAPYVSYRYCHICKSIKPPRAHHDSVSGRCVYNMDHYCPWMSTCVGFYNYRYFVLFLIYLQVSCDFGIALLMYFIHKLPPADRNFIIVTSQFQSTILDASGLSASSYCFTLVLAACISSGILLSWHLYLCCTGQTTIDFYINMRNKYDATQQYHHHHGQQPVVYKNPFDEGWRKNLRRVFGGPASSSSSSSSSSSAIAGGKETAWYRYLLPSFHTPPDPKYPFELESRPKPTINNNNSHSSHHSSMIDYIANNHALEV